ncbi:MAG: ligase-associated DNA damage response endonuclease PdeM [Bacteroidota bacterium]
MEAQKINVAGEHFLLHPLKSLYWPRKNLLLISDLHLGKVAHFRKHGLAVPAKAGQINLINLETLIHQFTPSRIVFLGDLFHSEMNSEWLSFKAFIKDHPAIRFELVIGNHDILQEESYSDAKLKLHNPYLEEHPILFSHHPIDDLPDQWYNFCGHIHPAIQLKGKGKQYLKVPCFYFGKQQGILPAFGAFTGLAKILPEKGDQVWGIIEKELIEFKT